MSAAPPDPEQVLPIQIELIEQGDSCLPDPRSDPDRPFGRDRLSVDLKDLGRQLRELAAESQVSSAALVRCAIRKLLGEARRQPTAHTRHETQPARATVKVTLRLSSAHAKSLAARARDAEVAQGVYVAGLLDKVPPAPRASDHSIAVEALMKSTDHLAAMSTDLNALMRMVGRVPSEKLNPLRERLQSLVQDVRSHLVSSAALMSELQSKRRPKR